MTPTHPRTPATTALRKYMADDGWDHGISLLDEPLEEAVSEYREALRQIRDTIDVWDESYSDPQGVGTVETLTRLRSLLDRSGPDQPSGEEPG